MMMGYNSKITFFLKSFSGLILILYFYISFFTKILVSENWIKSEFVSSNAESFVQDGFNLNEIFNFLAYDNNNLIYNISNLFSYELIHFLCAIAAFLSIVIVLFFFKNRTFPLLLFTCFVIPLLCFNGVITSEVLSLPLFTILIVFFFKENQFEYSYKEILLILIVSFLWILVESKSIFLLTFLSFLALLSIYKTYTTKDIKYALLLIPFLVVSLLVFVNDQFTFYIKTIYYSYIEFGHPMYVYAFIIALFVLATYSKSNILKNKLMFFYYCLSLALVLITSNYLAYFGLFSLFVFFKNTSNYSFLENVIELNKNYIFIPFLFLSTLFINPNILYNRYQNKGLGVDINFLNAIIFYKKSNLSDNVFTNIGNPKVDMFDDEEFRMNTDLLPFSNRKPFYSSRYLKILQWNEFVQKANVRTIFFKLDFEREENLLFLGYLLEKEGWQVVYHDIGKYTILHKK